MARATVLSPWRSHKQSNFNKLEAAKYGRAELLRHFKVDPTRDDLNALVVAPAAYLDPESELGLTLKNQASPEVVESLEYLLSFGSELRQLIGSSIMEQFFRQIDSECQGLNAIYPRRLMEYVLCLAKHGLQWDGENLRYLRSEVYEYDLEAQFRCAGNAGFVNWLDNTLEIRRTPNVLWNMDEIFEFRICENVHDLDQRVREKAEQGLKGALWRDSAGLLTNRHIGIVAFGGSKEEI